jgi:hypothetical protein
VHSDFSVELAAGDPTLELPWTSRDPNIRYLDLKHDPSLIEGIPEASDNEPLRDFLVALNSAGSAYETAKCDTWFSDQMDVEDEPFGAAAKFCCYVDMLFASHHLRFSFPKHEEFAKQIVKLLARAPEIPGSADFVIRRCHYHKGRTARGRVEEGFYFTLYCSGYGEDEAQARLSWSITLNLLQNALLQLGRV